MNESLPTLENVRHIPYFKIKTDDTTQVKAEKSIKNNSFCERIQKLLAAGNKVILVCRSGGRTKLATLSLDKLTKCTEAEKKRLYQIFGGMVWVKELVTAAVTMEVNEDEDSTEELKAAIQEIVKPIYKDNLPPIKLSGLTPDTINTSTLYSKNTSPVNDIIDTGRIFKVA